MLAATNPQVFIPFGRQHVKNRFIGEVTTPSVGYYDRPELHSDDFLLKKKKSKSLKLEELDNQRKENFVLREKDGAEEELYVNGKIVVHSRGNAIKSIADKDDYATSSRSLISTYTLETNISHALWSKFNISPEDKLNEKESREKLVPCICVIDAKKISLFSEEGDVWHTPLYFKVTSVWNTSFGILIERDSGNVSIDMTGKSLPLPTIYSLSKPLKEVLPLFLLKQGSVLQYARDCLTTIVFTSSELNICMMYDIISGLHSVWKIRKPTNEEFNIMCGQDSICSTATNPSYIPSNSNQVHVLSNSLVAGSGFLADRVSHGHPVNSSPFTFNSRRSTPNIMSPFNTLSPMTGVSHYNSLIWNSPSNTSRRSWRPNATITANSQTYNTPSSMSRIVNARLGHGSMYIADNNSKPVSPDICLEYMWTENQGTNGNQEMSAATKVFVASNFVKQHFLCYLITSKNQLMLVELNGLENNDIILGNSTAISAKDAEYLPLLNLTVIMDCQNSVTLYSGISIIGSVQLGSMASVFDENTSYFTATNRSAAETPLVSRKSLLSSTRNEDMQTNLNMNHFISYCENETQFMIPSETPYSESAINSFKSKVDIKGLRDPIGSRITLIHLDGSMIRVEFPIISSSPLVTKCLNALKTILKKSVVMDLMTKWYTVRNAPGTQKISSREEWNLFLQMMLRLLGYNLEALSLTQESLNTNNDTPAKSKKQRILDVGSDEDWTYMLKSPFSLTQGNKIAVTLGLKNTFKNFQLNENSFANINIDTNALLFPYIYDIIFSLHLVYEDLKLNTMKADSLPMIVKFLHQLATDLKLEEYVYHYWKDFPLLCYRNKLFNGFSQISDMDLKILNLPTYFKKKPPNIFRLCYLLMKYYKADPYPCIHNINKRSMNIIQIYGLLCLKKKSHLEALINFINPIGLTLYNQNTVTLDKMNMKCTVSKCYQATLFMSKIGINQQTLLTFPTGIAILLYEIIDKCRENPPTNWPKPAYDLIMREDLASQTSNQLTNNDKKKHINIEKLIDFSDINEGESGDIKDGMENLDDEVMKLLWNKDHRLTDVRNFLQSCHPVTIGIKQPPEASDHDFIEEQEKYLYSICSRTMALPIGRGMFTMRSIQPVVTEPLPLPKLCLSGRTPRGAAVELSHIDVVPNMNLWPLFHNGVAAGLRIMPSADNIDSTWILYNKPRSGADALPEHAGFLMALGLNGHITNLATMNTYDYLSRPHEMISIALLIGLAAAKRGTMDTELTRMLCIFIESLLPPTTIELDTSQNLQIAALLSIGLLYQKTAHRHIAEALLSEIGRPPGPEMDNSIDRESYSLAASLGLGLVVLGKGSDVVGLSDLSIADMLHYYMVGGHKKPLTGAQKDKYINPSYQIKEGEMVNVDVTSRGATLALGMMYFKTGNLAIANWMSIPDSPYLLDFINPEFILLKMLARGLIMWDSIMPTKKWIEQFVPQSIQQYCLVKPKPGMANPDLETINQTYCNIVAGCSMAMGLRFAGTANEEAFKTLLSYCQMFISLCSKSVAELCGKSTIETCINVTLLSLSMVMAGTGDLEVLRICRYLRSRVSASPLSVITYGSHLATHMALGLLFLGGGKFTLSTSPESIAALIIAFYPQFPTHSNDNRYHLQAFRHLYTLAAEPRILIPRDIDSGDLCYVHLKVVFLDTKYYKNQFYTIKAPCLLPELSLLKEVRVEDERYWSIIFERGRNWDTLKNMLNNVNSLKVKHKAGHLSYTEDPNGYKSLMAQSHSSNNFTSWSVSPEMIFGFSSDPKIIQMVRYFLNLPKDGKNNLQNKSVIRQYAQILFNSVIHDKVFLLPQWMSIIKTLNTFPNPPTSYCCWQLKLFVESSFTTACREHRSNNRPKLISSLIAMSIENTCESTIADWETDNENILKACWDTDKINDSKLELIKSAYCTLLDIPHKSQVPDLKCSSPLEMYITVKNLPLPAETISKLYFK
ncbi:anaphase-promoting complex subunit 1 [Adelges cooleyi]|uniref:anaphase-promoting complex subunit 1 n=1 Tax=Adelges cooleyi TaxID=133065 RepID=UPI00217F50AD|nr:anaphase-promoting complex subunit 1 [Adelges cooleyi]